MPIRRSRKTFTIDKADLDGIEITAFMLEEDANALEDAGLGNIAASDLTQMTLGDVKAVDAIRGLAVWLRMVAQRVRK